MHPPECEEHDGRDSQKENKSMFRVIRVYFPADDSSSEDSQCPQNSNDSALLLHVHTGQR